MTEPERPTDHMAAPPRWSIPIALLVAAIIAVAIVLPAERGVDPTGVGTLLGLTAMGQIKRSLAVAAEADAAADRAIGTSSARGYAPSPATIAETAGTGGQAR